MSERMFCHYCHGQHHTDNCPVKKSHQEQEKIQHQAKIDRYVDEAKRNVIMAAVFIGLVFFVLYFAGLGYVPSPDPETARLEAESLKRSRGALIVLFGGTFLWLFPFGITANLVGNIEVRGNPKWFNWVLGIACIFIFALWIGSMYVAAWLIHASIGDAWLYRWMHFW